MAIQDDDGPPMNAERARRGKETLAVYLAQTSQDADAALVALQSYIRDHENPMHTQMVDLIADLRHLADQERLPWSSIRQGYFYKDHPIKGFMESLNGLADREDLDWDRIMDSADMNHDEEVCEEAETKVALG